MRRTCRRGNPLYPGARIVGFRTVPLCMRESEKDAEWYRKYPASVPSVLIDESHRDASTAMNLRIGGTNVLLFHPGVAHTHGDLCAYLPKYNIVLTGDLLFFGYYPFIDQSPDCGASLPGTVAALRVLARDFPNAIFIPGHGKLARASDLAAYAGYLEDLHTQVERAYRAGETEDQAADSVDLSRWHRHILPSFPDDRIWPEWATADSNIRAAYQLQSSPTKQR
jgi:glyoxylase-like metal-dependent hydrolase (beta-lactamase superfamily II)